jgi:hypothetical protein
MPSIASLVKTLQCDFPQFAFEISDDFRWTPSLQTIYYTPIRSDASQQILHELGHALLGHIDYEKDITLLKIERDAWDYAKDTLAARYRVSLSNDQVQDALDSYRDWLHARSTCPACTAIGMQIKKQTYRCLACTHQWRVNEARICALRRYTIATK